jgi:hypothetical protein
MCRQEQSARQSRRKSESGRGTDPRVAPVEAVLRTTRTVGSETSCVNGCSFLALADSDA